jgi:hypothetical protein
MIMAPPNPGQSFVFDSPLSPPEPAFPGGIAIHNNIFGASAQAKESCKVRGRPPQPWQCFDTTPSAADGEDSWHRNLVYNTRPPIQLCNAARPISTGSPWARHNAGCVNSIADVGFVDLAKGNYRLGPRSRGKGRATDGRDVGADIDLLEMKTAGVKYAAR